MRVAYAKGSARRSRQLENNIIATTSSLSKTVPLSGKLTVSQVATPTTKVYHILRRLSNHFPLLMIYSYRGLTTEDRLFQRTCKQVPWVDHFGLSETLHVNIGQEKIPSFIIFPHYFSSLAPSPLAATWAGYHSILSKFYVHNMYVTALNAVWKRYVHKFSRILYPSNFSTFYQDKIIGALIYLVDF